LLQRRVHARERDADRMTQGDDETSAVDEGSDADYSRHKRRLRR
jgi:hypothetical protein